MKKRKLKHKMRRLKPLYRFLKGKAGNGLVFVGIIIVIITAAVAVMVMSH